METQAKFEKLLGMTEGVSKAGNAWKKQEFVVVMGDQYQKQVCMQAFGDVAEKAKAMVPGMAYSVRFDIESREFNGRWYTDVKAWAIEPATAAQQPAQVKTAAPTKQPELDRSFFESPDGSDLPF